MACLDDIARVLQTLFQEFLNFPERRNSITNTCICKCSDYAGS